MCRAFQRRRKMRTKCSFLSTLLDALAASVQRALAASLLGQLLASLLVWYMSAVTSLVYGGSVSGTGSLLGFECDIILVLVLDSLLGLLV